MPDDIAIKVENLSKRYRIGLREARHETLAGAVTDTITRPIRNLRRLRRLTAFEDGQPTNQPTNPQTNHPSDIIWALRDVSFEVQRGEVVGIIGRNGAGKSTLLKILSRITEPTSGRVELNGRVSSLLEVGTGFHPELTGRDNVYLNGAILGMTKAEIDGKFDEIVDFSGVEKFIDTPVKRYSSGMRVRLAFSVAAHLEPEILIVDEVLAVGDAAFQKKCLGKMENVAGQGRVVVFVSHNMVAVGHLCSRAVVLEEGRLVVDDEASRSISYYLGSTTATFSGDGSAYLVNRDLLEERYHPDMRITDVVMLSACGDPLQVFRTGDALVLRIYYSAKRQFASQAFGVHVKNSLGQEVFRLNTMPISGYPIASLARRGHVDLLIDSLPLTAGRYFFDIGFAHAGRETIIKLEELVLLDVSPTDVYESGMALDDSRGMIVVSHRWHHCPDTDERATQPERIAGEPTT